jgi:hypothetical protein
MRCAAILGLCLLLGSSSLWGAQEKKPVKIPLSKTSVRKGALRRGWGVQAELPAAAYQARIGTEHLLLFDLDGDETLTPGTDGLALSYGPFVVHLPEVLLLKSGQYKLAFDGLKTLLVTVDDLGAAQGYVADASLLTEMRMRAGVKPAALDAKACADSEKHCEYMKLNGLTDGSGGVSAHTEDPSKRGYTPEGAAAGAGGDLSPNVPDLRTAMQSWYATGWHGSPMVDPGLARFGVAHKHGVGVLYFVERGGPGGMVPHPADGAINLPREFSFAGRGEIPNPVPGSQNGRGCGFPIYVRGAGSLESAEVIDASGRPVAGTISSPSKPANPEWPTNSGLALFIPSKPLASMTTYRVTFKFGSGVDPMTWSFTTGR